MNLIDLDLLAVLYIIANLLSSLSYVPQIATLLKDKSQSKSVAISSWGMWLTSTSIALAYAVLRIHDPAVIFAGVVSFVGCAIVFSLLLFNRFLKAEGISIVEIFKGRGVGSEPRTYP